MGDGAERHSHGGFCKDRKGTSGALPRKEGLFGEKQGERDGKVALRGKNTLREREWSAIILLLQKTLFSDGRGRLPPSAAQCAANGAAHRLVRGLFGLAGILKEM